MSFINIRPIVSNDNSKIAAVIRSVLVEMGVPKVGTAYEDEALDIMFETYDQPRSAYYVLEDKGKVIGGGGIAHLQECESGICELQKMYFLPEARGKGYGFEMINTCLSFAVEQDYYQCYLETMPYMKAARGLYKKIGFKDLDAPLGATGHYSCQSWMIKDL